MLHVATVHFSSPRWIEIQLRHLRRHIAVPFEVWTSLEGIDPAYGEGFDHVIEQRGDHPGKLNHLALEISRQAVEDDLLMFLDGDAFPIADPMPAIGAALAHAELIAVQRAENVSDRQPHPCFCVTTVGRWRRLPGDWSPGYAWAGDRGRRVSDVGGNLLRGLELRQAGWEKLLRSNQTNLDPLFFAVYGDIVYHHGAGFRAGEFSRAHLAGAPARRTPPRLPVAAAIVRRLNRRRSRSWERAVQARYLAQSARLYERIARDDPGWLEELLGPPGAAG